MPSWISGFRVYWIISRIAQLNSYSTIKYESIQAVTVCLLEIHETHYANKLWVVLISGTTMHQIAPFHVWIFKNFLGRGSPSPLPRPLPPLILGLRPRCSGCALESSGASRPRLGLRPQCLHTKECISNIIPALLFFHFEPCTHQHNRIGVAKQVQTNQSDILTKDT